MLICSESEITSDNKAHLLQAVLRNASIQASAKAFLTRACADYEVKRKTICVQQGECARIQLEADPDVVLESDGATTCVIGVAICKETSQACIAHFDSSSNLRFTQWLEGMTRPEIYLAGDFILPEREVSTVKCEATGNVLIGICRSWIALVSV